MPKELILKSDWYSQKDVPYTVEEAVDRALCGKTHWYEKVDRIEYETTRARDMLTILIPILHEKLILTDEDIIKLVGHGFEWRTY